MRYSASDKTEIIRLVEQSHLPARRTLEKLGIPRSSFYRWYDRYQRGGPEGTAPQRLSAARLSIWRWISRNSARGNWQCASRTRQNILSQRPRFIGF
jgi:transposase-like protein